MAPDALAATLTPESAAGRAWDVVVIGAGPAGATAAHQLAKRGLDVLLIDKAHFPRAKVCGCCLSRAGVDVLERVGLSHLIEGLRGHPLRRLHVADEGSSVDVPLCGGIAVSRTALDTALIRAAIEAGVSFLPGTRASLGSSEPDARRVVLHSNRGDQTVTSRVVVVASGLGGRLLDREPGLRRQQSRRSYIGVGAVLPGESVEYEPGTVYMACGRGGYVGLTRLETGEMDVAAAMNPGWMRDASGPASAISAILATAGFRPLRHVGSAGWRGTPALTSRPQRVAGHRLFLVGDAAGYVEPFTGEGIAWAIMSGVAAAEFAHASVSAWHAEIAQAWERQFRLLVLPHQRCCRILTTLIRFAPARRAAGALIRHLPGVVAPLVNYITRAPSALAAAHQSR